MRFAAEFWPEQIDAGGCEATRSQLHAAWESWISGALSTGRLVTALRKAGCDIPEWMSFSGTKLAEAMLDHARTGCELYSAGPNHWGIVGC